MKKNSFFPELLSLILLLCCSCEKITDYYGNVKSKMEDFIASSEDSLTIQSSEAKGAIKYTDNAKASKSIGERRIYILDLTRSMIGYNNSENIFDAVKSQLTNAINAINDTTTEIVLIPFTDHPFEILKEKITAKDRILNYIDQLEPRMGDTNILDAWTKGEELLDPTKINYLFLLTDGIHNYGEPIDSLYNKLANWYERAHGKYEFAFYVLLTEKAREKEICHLVDSIKQMWLVPSMNINTDFIIGKMNLKVNIKKNNKLKLHLTCTNPEIFNDGFRFRISIPNNEYYRIINAADQLDEDGNLYFEIEKLKPQKDLPISYPTQIQIDYNREKHPLVFFTPEEYNIHIVNVGDRMMIVKQLKQ